MNSSISRENRESEAQQTHRIFRCMFRQEKDCVEQQADQLIAEYYHKLGIAFDV